MTMTEQLPQGPNWYDVLGVEADASTTEIRAAWREATDVYGPGTKQFDLFNRAAGVLLDAGQREAHDAALREVDSPQAREVDAPVVEDKPASPEGSATTETTDSPGVVARRALAVVALLTVLAVLSGVFMVKALQDRAVGEDSVRAQDAGAAARASAGRSLETVLSYDYRQMAADKRAAEAFMTAKFKREYAKSFAALTTGKPGTAAPVTSTKLVVKAQVKDTAVVDASQRRARILAFVDQLSEQRGRDPVRYENRVAVSMVNRDGTWLIDGITSY